MTTYLNLDEVLAIHREMIDQFGGSDAILDLGKVESAVAQPQMTYGGEDLYPSLFEKASALWFSLTCNHGFEDGNKRVGYAAMVVFLKLNRHDIASTVDDKEGICLALADHKRSRADLLDWLARHVAPLEKP